MADLNASMAGLPLTEAAEAASADPLSALLQYGVLGIVVVLLILYVRTSIKRENDRADKAEQQVQDLNAFIRAELLPKQVEQTLMYKQVTEVLEETVRQLSEAKVREEVLREELRVIRDRRRGDGQ